MEISSIALLVVFIIIGQFLTKLLGKGVALALRLGAGALVGIMLLRHFPDVANTFLRLTDTLWPAVQGFIDNGGRQAADILRGFGK